MYYYLKTKTHRIEMIIFIVLCAFTINIILPLSVSASELQPIIGETIANKEDMVDYYEKEFSILYPQEYIEKDVNLDKFIDIIMQEGEAEGVRADVVFAQILLETDWFKFENGISIEQNNFGGLKNLEGNYLAFDSIEEGIRANVQVLKEYSSDEPLNQEKVHLLNDIRTPQKKITYVEDLGSGNWSEDLEYGENIKQYLKEMANVKTIITSVEESEKLLETPPQKDLEKPLETQPEDIIPGEEAGTPEESVEQETKLSQQETNQQVEVKTLTIDGSGYVGGSHRIRSYGTSKNGVLYQFWIKDPSTKTWTMIQDYSKNSASWTPTKPGKYLYGVHIKDEKSNERLDAHLYKEINIIPAEIKALALDGSGYIGGDYLIKSHGESSNGVLYQFWIKDLSTNKWTMIQDYDSKSSVSWTPTETGEYLYGVHIKDKHSKANLDVHMYKEVTIKQPEVLSLTLDGSGYVGGSHRIRSLGKSANGVLYQFWVKDLTTNKWTMIQDYSKSSASWTPSIPGTYLYGVHIKDEKSIKRLDGHLYKEVTIKSPNTYYYTEYKDTYTEFVNKQLSNSNNKIDGSGSNLATKADIEIHSNPSNFVDLTFEPTIVKITGSVVNFRKGPSTSYEIISTVQKNEIYEILQASKGWYQINKNGDIGWVSGAYAKEGTDMRNLDITYEMYQFLDLTTSAKIDADTLDKYLNRVDRSKNKVLKGQGENFINASKKYAINPVYLVAHAMHETGFASSRLSNGTAMVDGQIVYNFFGISAYDGSAYLSGSQYAYKQEWFTQKAAIEGGARWISQNYINHSTRNQNTPYKMKWNPQRPATHQYATHVMWPTIVSRHMFDIYEMADSDFLEFDIPIYK